MSARLVKLPVANVVIGDRHRTDLGDIDALAASIRTVGLLHPIVVTENHRLIAGHRRLEAWKQLHANREPIGAHVVSSVDTAQQLLMAERDENTCRKDFAPSEAVALGLALEAIEKPKAEERQAAAGGNRLAQLAPSDKPDSRPGRVTTLVGPAVGMGARTYEKAKAVVAAANDTKAAPIHRMLGRIGAGLHPETAINDIVESFGLKIADQSHDATITSARGLLRVWYGRGIQHAELVDHPELLRHTLKLILDSWGPARQALRGEILEGMALFVERYDTFDAESLTQKLATNRGGPSGLLADARQLQTLHSSQLATAVAAKIVMIYNTKRRSSTLAPWWSA